MGNHKIQIDAKKCIGCGLCEKVCVAHNIELKGKSAKIIWDDCVMCGQCTAVCPKKAISISGFLQWLRIFRLRSREH